jgi:hypothetical protein
MGWRETAVTDGLDLPDAAFDDDPPRPRSPAPRRMRLKWYWLAAGLLLLLWLVLRAWTPR